MSKLKRFLNALREWQRQYYEEIFPLREPADNGDSGYEEYDEAYNEHLEALHAMVDSFLEDERW